MGKRKLRIYGKAPEPAWIGLLPVCSGDTCAHYDGKRCELMGFRPSRICSPEVTEMSAELIELRSASAKGKS